jgi:hypothetical protein
MNKKNKKLKRNLAAIEHNAKKFLYGPLWRNYVPSYISDQSKKRRALFEPKQGDIKCL